MWKMTLLFGRIRTLHSLRAEHCCPAAAVRQPGCLHRRPLGFAPPPHDGFALFASAIRMRLLATQSTIGGRVANPGLDPGLEGGQVAVLHLHARGSFPT